MEMKKSGMKRCIKANLQRTNSVGGGWGGGVGGWGHSLNIHWRIQGVPGSPTASVQFFFISMQFGGKLAKIIGCPHQTFGVGAPPSARGRNPESASDLAKLEQMCI